MTPDNPADWDTVVSGPADAEHAVLLLPGGWCTAMFYAELMAEPTLADIRLVAVTLPGNGGTPALSDLTVENYAQLTAELAASLRCTAIVGHSYGANVALEMVGSGAFSGPVVLLAPSFSRRDESLVLRIPDRLAPVLGSLPFAALRSVMPFALRGSPLPADRLATLVAELQKNDRGFMRKGIHHYLRYLDRYGSVALRLAQAKVPAWVVHGETGDGGLTDAERVTLEAHAWIRIITIPGNSFLTPNESPALVAGLVRDAIRAGSPPRPAG